MTMFDKSINKVTFEVSELSISLIDSMRFKYIVMQ